MEIYFIVISFVALAANIGVYFYDRKVRDNILQSKDPMNEFEKYTQKILFERGLKSLTK